MAESSFARQHREQLLTRTALMAGLRGLPAAIVVIAVLVILSLARWRQLQGETRSRYIVAAQTAMDAGKWAKAEMISRKIVELRPGDPLGTYLVALCAEADGDFDRAIRLMQRIAPVDGPGFPAAQLWLAQTLATQPQQVAPNPVPQIRKHLRQYVRIDETHAPAHMLLGQAELALGRTKDGLNAFVTAADVDPNLHLTVARVSERLGQTKTARAQAEQAVHWYSRQLKTQPTDVEAVLRLADAHAMLGDFEEAAEVLVVELARQDDDRIRLGLAKLAVTTFDAIDERPPQPTRPFEQQLELIRRTLPITPRYQPLLKRLALLTCREATSDGPAASLLAPYLETQSAPAVVHMVLAGNALQHNDYGTARRHYEAAHKLQPNFPACMNNLAWVLLHCDTPDLTRALTLVDQAIQLESDRPEFHDTRDKILASMDEVTPANPHGRLDQQASAPFKQTETVLAESS